MGKQKPKKNNAKKGNGKPRNVIRRVAKSVGATVADGLMMSPCAAKYALSIVNPWSPQAAGACIPSKPTRPSQKATAFARVDVVAPAGQSGYIVIFPTLCNDGAVAVYTNGATRVTPDTLLVDTPYTGLSNLSMSNLPYTAAQLKDNGSAGDIPAVSGRMVSLGVTAQYIGTELNRGGLTYCFTDPAHENVAGQTISDILARAETEVSTPMSNRDKCTMQISAINATELEYPDIASATSTITAAILACYPYSGGNEASSTRVSVGASPMVFIFTNPSTTGTCTFHVEIVAHVEYVGKITEGKTTANFADELGLTRIMCAADRVQMKKVSRPHVSFGKLFKETLGEVARETGTAAMMAGKAMLLAALV
jgi:hypothetical protein